MMIARLRLFGRLVTAFVTKLGFALVSVPCPTELLFMASVVMLRMVVPWKAGLPSNHPAQSGSMLSSRSVISRSILASLTPELLTFEAVTTPAAPSG